MKLELQRAYPDYNLDKSLRGTVVQLGNLDGATIPVLLEGNLMELSNQELFERALEVIYQENFPMRAENEKFNLYSQKIAEINEATARSKEQYEKVEEIMKLTTAMVNELIASLEIGEEDEHFEQI